LRPLRGDRLTLLILTEVRMIGKQIILLSTGDATNIDAGASQESLLR
jgi:hypothetical protein